VSRVVLTLIDKREDRAIAAVDGVFDVYDQREYEVKSDEPLPPSESVLRVSRLDARMGTLFFENFVGLAEVGRHRFRVLNSKLTSEMFDQMLDEVVQDAADLAFTFGAPTSLPFERRDIGTERDVIYHALAYLRHVLCRGERRMAGEFLQIARQPHRNMIRESRWIPVGRATSIGPAGLVAVAAYPEQLTSIEAGSRLSTTSLGVALYSRGRPMFPAKVLSTERDESFDTHENRLVKHVLRLALEIIAEFEGHPRLNVELQQDLRAMREQLSWMASFDFLREVSPLAIVPLQSSVLQRREGYREFLHHFLQLSLSSVLADERDRWHALLDLKNAALLYELWCFFAVKRSLDELLGPAEKAEMFDVDSRERSLKWSVRLRYDDRRVEVLYNPTYSRGRGSYSLTLRPDIVVRAKTAGGWQALVFDAKLRFDGKRVDALDEAEPRDWERRATREDLGKMHVYRDALDDVLGAFVLFPGSDSGARIFRPEPTSLGRKVSARSRCRRVAMSTSSSRS
jgi:uncharacterized protein